MPQFTYAAYDGAGRLVNGTIQGPDEGTVRSNLRHDGMFVTVIEESRPLLSLRDGNLQRRRIKLNDLVVFSHQLSTMVGAGMDLVDAFAVLGEQTENLRLQRVLAEISKEIESGTSLSTAMSRYPRMFSEMYVSLVRAGEVGGILDDTLLRAAQNLERELELREKVRAAFAYPIVVMGVAVLVIAVMLLFVVPVFANVYKQFKAELPSVTMVLIHISYFCVHYWWLILICMFVLLFALRRFGETATGKRILDRVKLRLPLVGKLNRKIAMARLVESLGALVYAGVPLLEALETSSRVAANYEYQVAVANVSERVKQGARLSTELKATGKFPTLVYRMVEVGEESGKLDEMLKKIGTFFQRDIDYTVRRLLTMLEPALTVVLGVIVGFILLALYLPVFTLATVIK